MTIVPVANDVDAPVMDIAAVGDATAEAEAPPTETAVDHAKPVGIFLHELLGLPASCRTVELKHACYGGTAGLMLAASWLRSGAACGRKALVVATDIARYDVGSEIRRLGAFTVFCVRGSEDAEAACPALAPPSQVEVLPGDHHFDGDYARIAGLIASPPATAAR